MRAYVAAWGTRLALVRAHDETDARTRVQATIFHQTFGRLKVDPETITLRPARNADLALVPELELAETIAARQWGDDVTAHLPVDDTTAL
jgi:hypothetical protein